MVALGSNMPLHSPQSAILAIVNLINYLQPEVVLVDSNAGRLLQMCKAELLQGGGGHDQRLAPRRRANQRHN
jgi:hypothetical protein